MSLCFRQSSCAANFLTTLRSNFPLSAAAAIANSLARLPAAHMAQCSLPATPDTATYALCRESYQLDGMYLHDPAAFAAVIAPELFTWRSGAVRVVTDGLTRGLTLMDEGKKVWNGPNAWMGRPAVSVAVGVDAAAVVQLVSGRLLVKPGSSCDSASPDLVQ